MDLQTLLIIILVILAINLIVAGVYTVLVLKDFRGTIKKANTVLDNVHEVTDAVANPVSTIAGLISGLTSSIKAVKSISSLVDNSKKKEEN